MATPKDITFETAISELETIVKLSGVGRKTANCVLVYAFEKPAIPVDIHVHRISNRLGLVDTKTHEDTEQELMKSIPKKFWIDIYRIVGDILKKSTKINFANFGRSDLPIASLNFSLL